MAESSNGNRPEFRDAFGKTLVELGKLYPNMLFLDADLHTSTKATEFKQAYPDRFYQIGIAEQNLFGIAAGLALEGFIPFPSTFAAFATRRALDQFAISICYPKLNVKVPGSYVGVPTSRAGASHNCFEDIAVMRSLPHLKIADPGSNLDLEAIMRTAMETEGPVYFRVARYSVPEIFEPGHIFEWGRGHILRSGDDVSLFGTGIMTHYCLQAAELLERDGIEADVVHMASIKPIDSDLVISSAERTGCAVTAENASIIGGFGSAVCKVLAESNPVPVSRIGVRDRFVESGGVSELLKLHSMQPEDIAEAATLVVRKQKQKSTIAK